LFRGGVGGSRDRSYRLRFRLDERGQRRIERFACFREHDAILRALRSGKTGLDGREIEREQFRVLRFGRLLIVKEALFASIGFDERDEFFGTSSEAQVAQTLFVDGEDAAGGAVFGSHVGNCGAIGQWKILQTGAEVFHELSDDAVLAQHFGNGEYEIGRGCTFSQAAG
jgi:hypothetical protein